MRKEEIIRAMELCRSGFGLAGCGACPYFTAGGDYIDCHNRMMADALEELKKGGVRMFKVRVPTEEEARILRENFLDPERYGVTLSTESSIHLICYKTRDEVTVRKGDRPWK